MFRTLFFMFIFCACLTVEISHASPQDRVATKARVEADISKDLALAWTPLPALEKRTCLDGRPVAGHTGDIVEYWANMECPFCGIDEIALAQKDNPEMCIVVRHSATIGISEAVKKALSYEALREFSVNAANRFWHNIIPRTKLEIAASYNQSLQTALQEAGIDMEKFGEAVTDIARERVSTDIVEAQNKVFSTPTFVLDGLRFPACDFKAAELPIALDLAKKARQGDAEARAKIIEIIISGILGEIKL